MPRFSHRRVADRLIHDLDPGSSRLHDGLLDPDQTSRPTDATLALVMDHYRFIDGQQRRELATLDARTTWRTTTMTLLVGAFALSLQRVVATETAADRPWVVVTGVISIMYFLALAGSAVAALNVGRGDADDMAMDAARTWERLTTLPADQVRYDITKNLAIACINTESLLRWKRTWSRRGLIALMLQFGAVIAMVILVIVRGA